MVRNYRELHMADFASESDGPNTSLYHKPESLDYSTSKKTQQNRKTLSSL